MHEPDDEVNPIVQESEPELEALSDTAEPEAVTEDAAEFGNPEPGEFPAGPAMRRSPAIDLTLKSGGPGREGRRRPRRRHPDRACRPPRRLEEAEVDG